MFLFKVLSHLLLALIFFQSISTVISAYDQMAGNENFRTNGLSLMSKNRFPFKFKLIPSEEARFYEPAREQITSQFIDNKRGKAEENSKAKWNPNLSDIKWIEFYVNNRKGDGLKGNEFFG